MTRQAFRKKAFEEVINTYLEVREVTGQPVAGGSHGGAARTEVPQGVVQATLSDFVADVEIIAKRELVGTDLKEFYALTTYEFAGVSLRDKLGRAFVSCGLFPLRVYFSAKDCRK